MDIVAENDSRRFELSRRDFDELARFISSRCGIRMPPAKKALVEGRLRRRVRNLGFDDMHAYCDFLFHGNGLSSEGDHIIDAITTNKTDFFREPEHFNFLARVALPQLAARSTGGVSVNMWSAAASVGAEAYTMAMVAADFSMRNRGMRFSVLGTDISSEVLKTAVTAVYPEEMVAPVPAPMRQRYLMRSRDRSRPEMRIVPELRQNVRFARLNLKDSIYAVPKPQHIVFCRNVLIYFDKAMQEAVLSRICECMEPGGYLFIGHSETAAGLALPLRQAAPTIFLRL
jgi:Methylase of chemotaxis methyl-accepting proteins